jgi:hypothetical protein
MYWNDLNNKLPEMGKWVLGLTTGGGTYQIRRIDKRVEKGYDRLDWMIPAYVDDDAIFSHWLDLPKSPHDKVNRDLYLNKKFIFPEDNEIEWSQDFCYYVADIPHNITFTLTDFINDERVVLRAKGYGLQGTDDSANYGNGSIFSTLENIIPYMRIDGVD